MHVRPSRDRAAGRPVLPWLALACAACAGDGGAAGFTLTLSPRLVDGQDLLGEGPEIELVITRPSGAVELASLGTAADGAALTAPEIAPLEPGTVVGLLAEAAGGTPGAWDPARTLAYGQVTVGAEAGGALDVLLPLTGPIARLGDLADARARMGAAMAMVPGGAAYLFGGNDPDAPGVDASDQIAKLSGLDVGDFRLDVLPEALPETTISYLPDPYTMQSVEGDFSGRTRLSATAFVYESAPLVLVAGGRRIFDEPSGIFDQWLLFDPGLDQVIDDGKLEELRTDHVAIPFRGGKTLLFGGFNSDFIPTIATYEIWDPDIRRSRAGENATVVGAGFMQPFGAPMGDDVVVCGGFKFTNQGDYVWTPQPNCARISPADRPEPLADLPLPLAAAAVVELPDGDLLVSGGITEEIREPNGAWVTVPATDGVYRLRDQTWAPVAQLAFARCNHAMERLADGRVLIFGGLTEGTSTYGITEEAVRCPELYDPADDSLTTLDCTSVGQGGYPPHASWPGEGAVFLEGWNSVGNNYEGGAAYGITSLGPPLEP